MRVLLINPVSGVDQIVKGVISAVPPLGLMDVGTQLLFKGHEVKIIDAAVNQYEVKKLVAEVLDYKADLIGMTSLTSNYFYIRDTVPLIRKSTDVPLVLGGVHATAMSQECVESGLFHYVISGEADESFLKLAEVIAEGETKNIPGVSYKSAGKLVINEPSWPKELKNFHMRSWELVDIKKYRPSPASYSQLPAISTMISRGCPNHKCTFCASRCIFGEEYRSYDLSQIRQELEYFKEKGIKDINFTDVNFTTSRSHTIAVSRLLGEFNFKWNITTRCDSVDLDLLRLIAQNGCYQIGYGIEVGTQEELERIGKHYTLEQVKKAVEYTKAAGISAKCFFSIGYPWQERKDIQKTVSFAKRLNPDIVTFSIVNPYPGTQLFEEYAEQQDFDFDKMRHRSAANTVSSYFSERQLLELMNSAYRQFYFRPVFAFSFAWRYLKKMRTFADIFNIFKGLRYILNK